MQDIPHEQAAAAIAALISKNALRFTFDHVPTTPKEAQIKWNVTLEKAGQWQRFNYGAGLAHLPCYKRLKGDGRAGTMQTVQNQNLIERELATGLDSKTGRPIIPQAATVLHCLALDAEAINYATFEQWAQEFGYDTDSRKAEGAYKECLRAGLFLRAILGESGLEELQTLSRFM